MSILNLDITLNIGKSLYIKKLGVYILIPDTVKNGGRVNKNKTLIINKPPKNILDFWEVIRFLKNI